MYKAKHFEVDKVEDLRLRLCTGHIGPMKKPIISKENAEKKTPEEIRSLFAECINNGRLSYSSYTMHHLSKRLTDGN